MLVGGPALADTHITETLVTVSKRKPTSATIDSDTGRMQVHKLHLAGGTPRRYTVTICEAEKPLWDQVLLDGEQ